MDWWKRPLLEIGLYGVLSYQLTNVREVSEDGVTYADADGPLRAFFYSGWSSARGEQLPSGDVVQLSVWEQSIKHAGAELRLLDVLSLQWGRFHEHERNGNRQFTTYGVGIDLYYLALNHSWTEEGSNQRSFWRLTGRIPLNRDDPHNFWPTFLDSL